MNFFRRCIQFAFSFHIRTLFLLMVAAIVIIPDVFLFTSVYLDLRAIPEIRQSGQMMMILLKMGLIAFLAIVILSLIVWFACKIIFLRPMDRFIAVTRAVSRHDLSQDLDDNVTTNHEFGLMRSSINQMIQSLNQIIEDILRRSVSVSVSSGQLTASSGQNKKASIDMARSLQEVAEAADHQVRQVSSVKKETDEINIAIASITQDSLKLADKSKVSVHTVQSGQKEMTRATQQMRQIRQTISELSELVRVLSSQSENINQMIQSINAIADETQMLSLNASIEAARAGEHGKGFSVVAHEIGKLADQSSVSARQIHEILDTIRHEILQIAHAMKNEVTQIDDGMNLVDHAGSSFREIESYVLQTSENIKKMDQEVNKISIASFNTASSFHTIEEMANNTSSHTQTLSAETQEQTAVAESVAGQAADLSDIADDLKKIAASFKVKGQTKA
ncbi:methyl-accepting chemotaxis protein [Sporolactobacillus sp. Y61]|uniref:Methyl-accepting chemotaxis protein n=1 Tax=Sporolactobacillus sp. Y61 TaxID=3160863 RepID=A0AAU8IJ75_9BACL|nr:methyl-accepting chemotaxis protein [Sporolactobacillus sp. THM19-2]RYL87271.1 methyl-accepting chemotaxis protein [Sporolactobacillus sp. THM19-2]